LAQVVLAKTDEDVHLSGLTLVVPDIVCEMYKVIFLLVWSFCLCHGRRTQSTQAAAVGNEARENLRSAEHASHALVGMETLAFGPNFGCNFRVRLPASWSAGSATTFRNRFRRANMAVTQFPEPPLDPSAGIMPGQADVSDVLRAVQISRRAVIQTGGALVANLENSGSIRVTDLRVYPVKSCGGISLTSSKMASTGLEFDRIFAVIDRNGFAQTQRRHRKMAAIRTSLDLERKTLTLETDGMEPLTVPLYDMEAAGYQRVQTTLGHGDPVPAWLYPETATQWLTRYLAGSLGLTIDGKDRPSNGNLRDEIYFLVRFDDATSQRRVIHDVGGENALPEDQVAFPDLYPLLITAEESLEEVDLRVSTMNVTMDRFRPNIVVAGLPKAFDEDSWAVIEIGEGSRVLTLRCLEQDPRCQIPSIDQRTGEKDVNFEPSRTLRMFRKLPFDFGKAGELSAEGPMFGIYAAHGGKSGELRVGDPVRIVERSTSGSLHEHWSNRPSKSV